MIEATARRDVMGVGIDCVTQRDVVEHVLENLELGKGGRIVTPNVDILRQVVQHQALRPLVQSAELVIADGAPVVWASHLQGTPLPERIAGATMMLSLTDAAARSDRSVFLLGGPPGAAEQAAKNLRASHRDLSCGWHYPPYGFERSKPAIEALVYSLADSQPDIVFCGFGFPKQERLMARLHELFPKTWFCGAGAAISFAAGDLTRAPEVLQRMGLEWLHRLVHEPRHLFIRYVVHDVPFTLLLLGDALRRRLDVI
jgi:N-acetylglucosaminyldiphosphoundecaprenol N-acetyl-beta-D-mannosaminyltransferase